MQKIDYSVFRNRFSVCR